MSIEFCPRCSARVRVPVAAEPESWVRCPRCRVETQLSEILSAEPPLLELIDGPSGEVPSYEPMLAGVGAGRANRDDNNDFDAISGDTMVTDEDSPTLPLGSISMGDNFFDDDADTGGASIGRATAVRKEDDELFGFDDNPDVAALRTTTDDGKYMDIPTEGDEEFNLSPDTSADFGAPAAAVPTVGAGFVGMPTGKIRRKKKSGMLPMMIGVAGGGLFGILIAYYGILMWAMGQDPFKVAKYFPESMQMLLPASLQDKSLAGKLNPPAPGPENTPAEPMMPPEEGNMPNNDVAAATANGEGETGPVAGLPRLGGSDTETPIEKPMTDPSLDPLVMPEKATPKPPVDAFDPMVAATPPKPANNPLDPFGNDAPIKPDMPKPELATPSPLDSFDPGTPKPEATNPLAAVDPLTAPVKPEMPAKPELANNTADPFGVKPIDPLPPPAVDPLAAPAKPKDPLMLTSASYPPEEVLKSLMQVETATGALAAAPTDRKLQAELYRAYGHVGEVAGQLKSFGETDEMAKVNLDSIQALSKKLADDPVLPTLNTLTFFWQGMGLDKRNNGIIIQGIPGTSEPFGKLHKTSFDVANPKPDMPGIKLTVVSEYPLLPGKDGKVTLLGVIVEKPAEQIPGYTGPEERVIWASVAEMEKPASVPAVEAKSPDAPAPAPKAAGDDPFGDIK